MRTHSIVCTGILILPVLQEEYVQKSSRKPFFAKLKLGTYYKPVVGSILQEMPPDTNKMQLLQHTVCFFVFYLRWGEYEDIYFIYKKNV